MSSTVTTRRIARALRPGKPHEVIEIATQEVSPPEPGEALVRVEAAALNHSEILALRGGHYAEGLRFPAMLGYEGAGTVIATGSDVAISVGTRVCWGIVVGSCADYLTAPASMLVPIPDQLELEQAARVPSAGGTAQLLARVWPLEGKTALVWGAAGPVGRMLTALLTAQGTHVIGVASGARTDVVRELGAHAIDRITQQVPQAIGDHTDQRGVDAIFDPVGASTYRDNLAMLARRGCLINHGQLSGELPNVDLLDLMDKGLYVTKFGGGGAYLDAIEDLLGLVVNALAIAVQQPTAISDVGGRFPLDQAADAYQALESGVTGKVLVVPDHQT